MFKFKKPLKVTNGRIVDADGNEVRLWGINYYLPFNNNYVNIEEMGVDHLKAVDRDIADFKRMGVELVRMHVYEREITDLYGNIVENDHLRIMDYLIDKLEAAGIYVMMTPIVWYNTVVNQLSVTKHYAYWSAEKCETFSYANLFPNHAMVWHEKALEYQENYLNQFFARKNVFSGKRLDEYDSVVVVEVSNETVYPCPDLLCQLREERQKGGTNPLKLDEMTILDMYDEYRMQTGVEDTKDLMQQFCIDLVKKYLDRMFGIVDKYFKNSVLKSHIHYGFNDPGMFSCLEHAPINCISVTCYAPCYFDTSYNDRNDFLENMRDIHQTYQPLLPMQKGFIAYEFDAPTTLLGHPMGAFGYTLASMGVQIAAHFTYTPMDVAAYNPGWIVHYMNLRHTPTKAAAFIAAGEIFRNTPFQAPMSQSSKRWQGDHYIVDVEKDLVVYQDEQSFIYSNPCESVQPCENAPARIVGSGSSQFVTHEGNGVLLLEKAAEDTLHLTVLPNQWYVNDPYRGKSFRFMANRYVDTNREWIVSRLRENGTDFQLHYAGFENYTVSRLENGQSIDVIVTNGIFRADPGEYVIKAVRG
ncbi:MAG TPA: hypothetical protein VHV83_15400 [Armatimonadota bacterium]|nr:hypothetical protein [Armatimonadota bacterium]